MSDCVRGQMPAQPRRLSLRLPHWSWLLVATGILIVGAVGVGAASYIYGQWTARKTIERVGGWIATEANCPEWLRAWCQDSEGNSPFDDIVGAYLNSERVTDSDLKPLWVLSRLKTLDLSGNQITDEGLRSIAGLSQLESLDLCGTIIGEAGLAHLRNMKRLESLDLPGFKLTEQGLAELCRLPNLKEVKLHGGEPLDGKVVEIAQSHGFDLLQTTEGAFQDSMEQALRGTTRIALVYCYAPKELKWDNETVDYDIAKHAAHRLLQNKVKVIDPDRVYAWLDKNDDWPTADAIGKHFAVDYVVHLDVNDFGLFEPNSADLYRGQAALVVNVVKMDENKDHGRVVNTCAIESIFPRVGPVGSNAVPFSAFKRRYLAVLSAEIASRFYGTREGSVSPR